MTTPKPLEYVEKKGTRIRVHTPVGAIEGLFHHVPGIRLTDALRNLSRDERYLLLTDCTIARTDVPGEVEQRPFMLVSLAHAITLIPLEE